jgi:CheY-like chemotaxis protein
MSWLPWFGRKKKVLCFIDDDPDEVNRFMKAMASQPFVCVAATTHEGCIKKLKDKKLTPDLWVLDLYYPEQGKTNSQDELNEMADEYAKLEQRSRDFRALLRRIGQGTEGGLNLLQRCRPPQRGLVLPWRNYYAPVVMLTRKGTLDDALTCQDAGAIGVLKKPMPWNLSGTRDERKLLMDDAMVGRAADMAGKFSDAIRRSSFLYKHSGIVSAVGGALFAAVASGLWRYFVG